MPESKRRHFARPKEILASMDREEAREKRAALSIPERRGDRHYKAAARVYEQVKHHVTDSSKEMRKDDQI